MVLKSMAGSCVDYVMNLTPRHQIATKSVAVFFYETDVAGQLDVALDALVSDESRVFFATPPIPIRFNVIVQSERGQLKNRISVV